MMRDWSLGSGENRDETALRAFDRIAAKAVESHGIALHYQQLGSNRDAAGQVDLEDRAAGDLEAMRQALSVAGPGMIAAALVYLAGQGGDRFNLTAEQRQGLHTAAGELDMTVWEILVGI